MPFFNYKSQGNNKPLPLPRQEWIPELPLPFKASCANGIHTAFRRLRAGPLKIRSRFGHSLIFNAWKQLRVFSSSRHLCIISKFKSRCDLDSDGPSSHAFGIISYVHSYSYSCSHICVHGGGYD